MNVRRRIEISIAALAGLAAGLGGYTFVYAKRVLLPAERPRRVANCHVMREQLDGWAKSSHRAVAGCNDCHTPHDFIGKYSTKAANGFFHSLAFTTGRCPDSIRIKARNRRITEAACRRCHEDFVLAMDGPHQTQKV